MHKCQAPNAPPVPPRRKRRKSNGSASADSSSKEPSESDQQRRKLELQKRPLPPPPPLPPHLSRRSKSRFASYNNSNDVNNVNNINSINNRKDNGGNSDRDIDGNIESCPTISVTRSASELIQPNRRLSANHQVSVESTKDKLENIRPSFPKLRKSDDNDDSGNWGRSKKEDLKVTSSIRDTNDCHRPNSPTAQLAYQKTPWRQGQQIGRYPPLFFTLNDYQNVLPDIFTSEERLEGPVEKLEEKLEEKPVKQLEEKSAEKLKGKPAEKLEEKPVEKLEEKTMGRSTLSLIKNTEKTTPYASVFMDGSLNKEDDLNVCFRVTPTNLPFERCLDRWNADNDERRDSFIFESYMDRSNRVNVRRSKGELCYDVSPFDEPSENARTATKVRFVIEEPISRVYEDQVDEVTEGVEFKELDCGSGRSRTGEKDELPKNSELDGFGDTPFCSTNVPWGLRKVSRVPSVFQGFDRDFEDIVIEEREEERADDDRFEGTEKSIGFDQNFEDIVIEERKEQRVEDGHFESVHDSTTSDRNCEYEAIEEKHDAKLDKDRFESINKLIVADQNLEDRAIVERKGARFDEDRFGSINKLIASDHNLEDQAIVERKGAKFDGDPFKSINDSSASDRNLEDHFESGGKSIAMTQSTSATANRLENDEGPSTKELHRDSWIESKVERDLTVVFDVEEEKVSGLRAKSSATERRKIMVAESLRMFINDDEDELDEEEKEWNDLRNSANRDRMKLEMATSWSLEEDVEVNDANVSTSKMAASSKSLSTTREERFAREIDNDRNDDRVDAKEEVKEVEEDEEDEGRIDEFLPIRIPSAVPVSVRRNSFLETMLSDDQQQHCEVIAAHPKANFPLERIGVESRSVEDSSMRREKRVIKGETVASAACNARNANEVKCDVLNELLSNFDRVQLKSVDLTKRADPESVATITEKTKIRSIEAEPTIYRNDSSKVTKMEDGLDSRIQRNSLNEIAVLKIQAEINASREYAGKTPKKRDGSRGELGANFAGKSGKTNSVASFEDIRGFVKDEEEKVDRDDDGGGKFGGSDERSRLDNRAIPDATTCAIVRKTTTTTTTSTTAAATSATTPIVTRRNDNDNNRAARSPVAISNDQSRDTVMIIPGSVRSFVKYYEIRRETTNAINSKINDRIKPVAVRSCKAAGKGSDAASPCDFERSTREPPIKQVRNNDRNDSDDDDDDDDSVDVCNSKCNENTSSIEKAVPRSSIGSKEIDGIKENLPVLTIDRPSLKMDMSEGKKHQEEKDNNDNSVDIRDSRCNGNTMSNEKGMPRSRIDSKAINGIKGNLQVPTIDRLNRKVDTREEKNHQEEKDNNDSSIDVRNSRCNGNTSSERAMPRSRTNSKAINGIKENQQEEKVAESSCVESMRLSNAECTLTAQKNRTYKIDRSFGIVPGSSIDVRTFPMEENAPPLGRSRTNELGDCQRNAISGIIGEQGPPRVDHQNSSPITQEDVATERREDNSGEEVIAVPPRSGGQQDGWKKIQRLTLGTESPSNDRRHAYRPAHQVVQPAVDGRRTRTSPRTPQPPLISCRVNAKDIGKYFDWPNKENSHGNASSPGDKRQQHRLPSPPREVLKKEGKGDSSVEGEEVDQEEDAERLKELEGNEMGSNLSRHNGKGLTGRRTQSSGNLCEPKGKLNSMGKILVPCSSAQRERYKLCGSLPNHLDDKDAIDDDPGDNNNIMSDTIAKNFGGTLPHKKRALGVHFSDGGPTGTLDLVKHRSQDSLDENDPWRYQQSDLDLVRCRHNFDFDRMASDTGRRYAGGGTLENRCHRNSDLDLLGTLSKRKQDHRGSGKSLETNVSSSSSSSQQRAHNANHSASTADNDDLLMRLMHKPDCELLKHRQQLSKIAAGGEPQDQGYASERSPEDEHPPSLPGQSFPSVTPENTFRVTLQKTSRGLGFSVSGGGTAGPIRIKRLFPQQPAALSNKLQPGDVLLVANGVHLNGLTNYEALEVLRTTSSTVELLVSRPLGGVSVTPPGAPPPPPARREPPPPPLRILNPLPPLRIEPCGEFDIEMTKVGGSLGFTLRKVDSSALGHYVRALVREPALSDGRIQPGDKIVAVDGAPLSPMSHEEAVALLRKCGPKVQLRLYRDLAQTPVSALSPTEPDHPLRPPRTCLRQEAVDMLCDLAVRKLSPGASNGSSSKQSPGASCSSPRKLRRITTRTNTAEIDQETSSKSHESQVASTGSQAETSDSDQCSIKTQITNSQANTPGTDIIDPPSLYDVCESSDSSKTPTRPNFLDLSAPPEKPHFQFCSLDSDNDYPGGTVVVAEKDSTRTVKIHHKDRSVSVLFREEQDTDLPSEPASMPPVLSSTSSTSTTAFSYKNPAYQSANPACGASTDAATKNKPIHSSDQDIPGKILGAEDPDGSKGLLKWKGVMFAPDDEPDDKTDKGEEKITTDTTDLTVHAPDDEHEQGTEVFMVELTRGWNSRLGFSLQPEGHRTVISVVHPDSVAFKDGRLKQGDILMMVNNESVETMSTSDIIDLLRKIRGSIGITVMRRHKQESTTT